MKVLICASMQKDCEDIQQRIQAIDSKYGLNISLDSMTSAKKMLFQLEDKGVPFGEVDLIILESNINGENGFEVVKKLRKADYCGDILFFAEDKEQAIYGYDVFAYNYILHRELKEDRFERVIRETWERAKKKKAEYIMLTCAGEGRKIDLSEIQYFEVQKRIVTVHYGKGHAFEFYSSLAQITEQLFGKGFLRVHSSYLIAKRYVTKIDKKQVTISTGITIPIGRTFLKDVKTEYTFL